MKLGLIVATLLIFSALLLVGCDQFDFDGPNPPDLLVQTTSDGLKSVRFRDPPSVIELREISYEPFEGQTSVQFLEYLDGDMQLIIFPPNSGCAVVKVSLINWSSQPYKLGFYVTPRQATTNDIKVCHK